MPLCFITISLPTEKESKRVIKKFYKVFKDDTRFLVKEYGKKESHLHYHAMMDLPIGLVSHTKRFCQKLDVESVYGVKIVKVPSSKKEMWYIGYMLKEIKRALPVDIFSKRVLVNIYGEGYLKKAWDNYSGDPDKTGSGPKDSYDGTLLATKIARVNPSVKKYDDSLKVVYKYSIDNKVDVKRPDTIANMVVYINKEKL